MKTIGPLLSAIILLLVPLCAGAQFPFEKIYGGKGDQYAFGMAVVPGGYAIAGHTSLPGSLITDAWILFLDENGDTLWTRKFGGDGIDNTRSVIFTDDQALVACGTYSGTGPAGPDLFLVRMNLNGDTLWTRREFSVTGAYGYCIAPAPDGYILCGYADTDKSTPRMLLVRTDVNGDTLWTRLYGDSLASAGFSVVATASLPGFAACGYIDEVDPEWDRNIFVVRTDSDGDTLWTRSYPNPGYDVAWCISETADLGFILTGYRNFMGSAGANIYIMRLDMNGELLWDKNYGLSGLDIGYSGVQTQDGGFIFCGQSNEQGSEFQGLYLVRTDPQGDSVWTRHLGDYPKNSGSCVRELPGQGFIVAGGTNSQDADGLYDAYIVRTDPDGTITNIDPAGIHDPGLNLFPNPCNGIFMASLPEPPVGVYVFDIQGRSIETASCKPVRNGLYQVALDKPEKGIYFVKITTLQNTRSGKIIVQ